MLLTTVKGIILFKRELAKNVEGRSLHERLLWMAERGMCWHFAFLQSYVNICAIKEGERERLSTKREWEEKEKEREDEKRRKKGEREGKRRGEERKRKEERERTREFACVGLTYLLNQRETWGNYKCQMR